MSELKAEHMLAKQGLFKGHDGLRGLLKCDDFWDKQEYGTRLYFDDGAAPYLHRDCLNSAVKALDAAGEMYEALKELVEVSPCQNGCAIDDMTCATRKAEAAIDKAEGKP